MYLKHFKLNKDFPLMVL